MKGLMEYASEKGAVRPPISEVLEQEAPGGGTVLESILSAREAGVTYTLVSEWLEEVFGLKYSGKHIGEAVRRATR